MSCADSDRIERVEYSKRGSPVFYQRDGKRVTLTALARRLGVSRSTIKRRLRADWPVDQLERPPRQRKKRPQPDKARLFDLPFEQDELAQQAMARAAEEYENGERLTPGMTLAEIAELYGLSRERIRQIEAGALRKLRSRSGYLLPGAEEALDEIVWERARRDS